MKVCSSLFKVPAPLSHFCYHSWKFYHTHYSFVDAFRLHCTSSHGQIQLEHALHMWRETLCFRHVDMLTVRSDLSATWHDRRAYCWHCATHRKASSQFHCSFSFATDRTLKKIALIWTDWAMNRQNGCQISPNSLLLYWFESQNQKSSTECLSRISLFYSRPYETPVSSANIFFLTIGWQEKKNEIILKGGWGLGHEEW